MGGRGAGGLGSGVWGSWLRVWGLEFQEMTVVVMLLSDVTSTHLRVTLMLVADVTDVT
jgi:hypothetical protein